MRLSAQTFFHPARCQPALLRRQRGLSLIELMISITIGLLLLAGITALMAQQSQASSELEKASRQIENGRYAMQVLQRDIQLAGYYGEYYNLGSAPTSFPNPCTTEVTPPAPELPLSDGLPLPIQGYDSPSSVPAPLSGCLADSNHVPGTDILVIRHTDTAAIPITSAVAGQIYLQTGLDVTQNFNKGLGSGSDISVFTYKKMDGTAADLRKYLVHIYFVSPCNVPADGGSTCTGSGDDNGNPVPTLKRLELSVNNGATAFTIVPLVEGIENFQLDYGLDTNNDGAPDTYTTGTYSSDTTAMTPVDWANVMTVRVNLLARNNEKTAGHTDSKTYALGSAGTVGPFNDAYKRRVFSAVVRAVNSSSRRER